MKKAVCFYFQVHQPTRLRQYRFFDIGKDSHYLIVLDILLIKIACGIGGVVEFI